MEAKIGGEAHHFYGIGTSDLRVVGKRSSEWDSNEWKWDGDLFIASPMNPVPSDYTSQQFFPHGSAIPVTGGSSNSSSSCSDEVNLGIEKRKRELEKRRRVIVVQDDNDETGTLSLKLGGHGHSVSEREVGNWEGTSGKKTKLAGVSSSRAVCQVEDCGADLSKAKDYHRRHKVCEMHSKAGCALVGNDMQRFCQQCSRFHVLQEFDEGKRSCRRRLAGHNKRRRKTHPDAAGNGNSLNDDQASGYLLISLLRILSNMHSNDKSDQTKDQDLLSHLLRSLASYGGTNGSRNISGLLQESQLLNDGISVGNTEVVSALLPNGSQAPPRPIKHLKVPESEILPKGVHADDARVGNMQMTSCGKPGIMFPIKDSLPVYSEVRDSTAGQIKLNNFDLNDIYIDSDDGMEDLERSPVPENLGTGSLECPSWVQQDSHQSSPPQTSGNSDSASAQSPSSSSGEAQSRTDRIVFKLFGKEPNDFPLVLRAQILDWLSHSPTDIESYIRPGCIVLTIYLRLPESTWEELCCDLGSSLSRLLDVSNDTFWRTGWVYIRVQHQIAFIYNGQVVVDMSLPLKTNNYSKILSIKPIAISMSEEAQFLVKGFNLSRPATRLLCALEGKYLVKEATHELMDDIDSVKEHDELQYLNFSCSIPKMTGRGFIEVEDHGLSSSFFPIIVAEKDVCSEICMLESTIEMTDIDEDGCGTGKLETKNQAMDFIHEIGWLLHRSQLKSRLGHLDPNADLFSFKRFKWLMEFSMDRDWCAVVKKLLDIMLDGTVGAGEYPSLNLAFMEMGLLHRAVRRNSRPLVELLLRYVPERVSDVLASDDKSMVEGGHASFLLRPDVVGPAGLTPLHIAAGRDGSEDVLDALTDDPGMVGGGDLCLEATMAQLQAISSYSSTNLIFRRPKPESSPYHDKLYWWRKLPFVPELGTRGSGINGQAIVHNNGSLSQNLTRVYSNQAIRAVVSSEKETVTSGASNSGLRGKLNKVVLAYSGGLDTSVIVPWLRENYGCEVVCFTADVGQGIKELEGLEEKAKASGACQLVVKDLKEEFVKDYIFPCLRAGAIYERKYLLGTSMARPVIAKAMVDVAKEVGADAVSHGCTGKGNDQVRFELTFFALNPELNVVAPWREWEIRGREDAIEYAKKHNVPVPVTKKSIYSRDRNLWHLSHEGDILEDPENEPKNDMYMMSVDPEHAPDQPEYIEIGMVSGLPVSVNGEELSPASLLSKLNEIGGRHGIGRIDMVENRLVGMKSRGVYETPGGTILFTAARELESLTLDRESIQQKDSLALKYAELVYAGRWFDPLRESIDAFMKKITETTTGSVRLKLYKGSVTVAGLKSPYSLYRQDISSFESGQIYDQADAAGFIRLYGLPMKVRAMLEKGI